MTGRREHAQVSPEPIRTTSAALQSGMRWVVEQSRDHPMNVLRLLDSDFIALPGVFSPEFCASSVVFAQMLCERIRPGNAVLEMGAGIGVASVSAAKRDAVVVAVDVNPLAVRNTRVNAIVNGVESSVATIESDLFDEVGPMYFDVVYWNAPFGNVPRYQAPSLIERSVFDPGYGTISRFLRYLPAHLLHGGAALIGFSSTLGDLPALMRMAESEGFRVSIEESVDVAEGRGPGNGDPLDITYELVRLELR